MDVKDKSAVMRTGAVDKYFKKSFIANKKKYVLYENIKNVDFEKTLSRRNCDILIRS